MILTPLAPTSPQLQQWSLICAELNGNIELNWKQIFDNLYTITNNYKLIQHQYKIFTRIATSNYIRHKMKISNTYTCSKCFPLVVPETLEHIYLKCPQTITFHKKLAEFITSNIDPNYNTTKLIHITCLHPNKAVNFLNLVGNWYIGRKFQKNKQIYWDEYISQIKWFLIGEKSQTRDVLNDVL